MQFTIRAVRGEDWQLAKELRLAALQDPVASIAFLDTYERSVVQADEFWQGRTADAAEGRTVRQLIGEDGDGRWLGTVTVLVEPAGVQDYFGHTPAVAQTHVVGVYVRPEARGTGLAPALFEAALAWSWALPDPKIERVRLYVHEDNARARALYEKAGFTRTGVAVAVPAGREFEYAVDRD
ncbi:GNAT family N-acetyltransferase [Dactylosporangium siamense]|uniref:N-acetyltransferase n=1 Tax=Dactylosporangium siamense TaxID=685454 RepID=A0A919PNF9_9ACTN|nr:GNAT family N-acetyltransferase [Dactylosporangium siamense]GIG46832.1 N-acetyltransferase [Dactylosporangium siamense]